MAFGWKPFIVAAPRAHHFLSLDEATSAIEQIIMESSLLAYYSVSPHLSLADLFMLSVQGSHEPSEELRAGITAELEICDVPLTDHEFQLASLKDDNAKSEWFVVHHNGEEGHLFLVGDQDNVSWVPESRRGSCWSSADEMAALSMAKTVTRREGYYAYPLRFPKVAGN
jgi:hypothetical protein